MSRFLVYVSPAVGHTLPLVPGLLELQHRGHEVHVLVAPTLVGVLRGAGLDASPVAPAVADVPVTDYLADDGTDRLRTGQVDLMARGKHDGPDLARAIAAYEPDVLLVDVNAHGARAHAEASGLPWATLLPSVIPLPGAGIPPYGPGLRPMRGLVGWLRDRIVWKVVERAFGKAMLPGLNELRADVGLAPYCSPLDQFEPPGAVIALTSEPLEYPRSDLPEHIHMVGTQPWDPPAARPAYLDEPGDPWVLVTCSTEYQGDEELARVAVEALRDEPVRVLLTLADAYGETTIPRPATCARSASCHTARCCPTRQWSCATAAWASSRRLPRPAYPPLWCRSGATNRRSRGGSCRPAPESRSSRTASRPMPCATRCAPRAR